MKVFVFQPNNASIGRFEVDRIEALGAGFDQFLRTHQVEAYDFLECEGRTWTAVAGPGGLGLVEGRVERMESPATALGSTPPLLARYRRGYQVATAAVGFGQLLKGIGWTLGVLSIVGGVVIAQMLGGDPAVVTLIYAFIIATAQVIVFIFFGVLVTALGEILRATLDTAVHTSPFLDDQQKSQAVDSQLGE